MVKLLALPEQSIIDGFKGVIDFYVHYQTCNRSNAGSGTPCARSWPRSPGQKRASAVEAQWSAFSFAASNWNSLDPYVQAAYKSTVQETNLTPRDLFTKAFITDYFREGQWSTLSKPPVFTSEEIEMLSACWAFLNTVMNNLTSGTWYKVLFDAEVYDIGGDFDCVNNQFVAPVAGRYLISTQVLLTTATASGMRWLRISQNGAEKVATNDYNNNAGWQTLDLTAVLDLAPGDIITVEIMQGCGVNTVDVGAYSNWTNIFVSLFELP